MHCYVLDANALMARIEVRAGADAVEALLNSAQPGSLLMSVVNWGEVYYNVWRSKGQEQAERILRAIDNLPIILIDVNRETAKLAAELKAKFGLGYADSFAAALTQQTGARLVTGDLDFKKVENVIAINWLP